MLPPYLPYDELQAHVGEEGQARSSLDALKSAMDEPQTQRAHVEHHVDILRGVPAIATVIENWYDLPSTQNWLKTLSDIGL